MLLFVPHGHCYLWHPSLVSAHVISDAVIAASYYAIPAALMFFASRRDDIPYPWIFALFSSFIVACGTSHVMAIITVWHGWYWASAWVKSVTALISAATAIILIPLMPKLLALPKAFHDSLTQLPNRTLFTQQIDEELGRVRQRRNYQFGLLLIDLDGFKGINDTLGHNCGDELLVQVAERLRNCVRHHDLVARYGGDEFAIVLGDVKEIENALQVAERITEELNTPFILGGITRTISGSVGVRLANDAEISPNRLVNDADDALYKAKEQGKNQYVLYGTFS